MSNILPNNLTMIFSEQQWRTSGSPSSEERPKQITFSDFKEPGTEKSSNIKDYNSLNTWLINTSNWLKNTYTSIEQYKETIINNIWTKHQKIPYNQFPPNMQETLIKLKKQGILTDLNSLTFEMARVLTVLDAANAFNKYSFSFVAVSANYDIARHNLSFAVTLNSFPWNEDTEVKIATETNELYATFTKRTDTSINFQVSNSFDSEARKLAQNFKKFQTISLTKGV